MSPILAIILAATFFALAGWHFYWALGGQAAKSGAVPEVGGRPAFVPSRRATVLVGMALLGCAALVVACGHLIDPLLPRWIGRSLCFVLATALALRAFGDFRLLGFTKRVRNSEFARRDTWVYSPLCTLLALGVAAVGSTYEAR